MTLLKVVGIDIGRSSISCCVLSDEPDDLKEYAEGYKPITLKPTAEDVSRLLSLGDVFILEPTGADYWFWADVLQDAGVPHHFVSGVRIRNFAKTNDITSKGDREDAACIACYGLISLRKNKRSAFLDVVRTDLREHWLTLRTLPKTSTAYQNKIKARLVFEMPHLAKAKPTDRGWAETEPSKLWRELAGIELTEGRGRKRAAPERVVGRSTSWVTENLAQLLCAHETFQGRLEQAIEQEVEKDATKSMCVFQSVLEAWGISDRVGIAILSACHPLEQFLNEDGGRIRRRKWNSKGTQRNGCDKTLKAFQRAMAFGQIKVQSGQKMVQIPTGDRYVRDAVMMFLATRVVMARQPTKVRLFKLFGKPEQWDGWKENQQKAWVLEHSFEILHKDYHKPDLKELGDERFAWNNPEATASVMAYNGVSEPLARLQLFYQFAPQCQNLKKWQRIKKVYSKFIRMLLKDLIAVYQTLEERGLN